MPQTAVDDRRLPAARRAGLGRVDLAARPRATGARRDRLHGRADPGRPARDPRGYGGGRRAGRSRGAALALQVPFILAGLALLVLGAHWLVGGAVAIARWAGVLFLVCYAACTDYLVLAAVEHDHLGIFSAVMAWFVLPLTVVTLAVLAARAGRRAGTR